MMVALQINMNKLLLFTIAMFIAISSTAQKLTWSDVPHKTRGEISWRNDTVINPNIYPNLHPEDNGLVYEVGSTEIFFSDDSAEQKRIEQIFAGIVSGFIQKNKITDNNETKELCAITTDGNLYHLRKHRTIKRYLFWEGAGVRKYVSIDEKPGFRVDKVFCIFRENIIYHDSDFSIFKISPLNNEQVISPNKIITFSDNNNNYELTYLAEYCTGGFEYKGYGTMSPTFYNLRLDIKDLKTGNTQRLLQIPHDRLYQLKDIQIADINGDKKVDIVIHLTEESCIRRLVYISTPENNRNIVKFIGHMIFDCIYP